MSQTKINESMNNKLLANDKTLETLNAKMDDLASAVKNQLSFNKIFETRLAQIAAAIPVSDSGKILGQLETCLKYIKMVSTRFGKPLYQENYDYLKDPPFIAKKRRYCPPNNHVPNWSKSFPQCHLRPWSKY